MFVFYKTSRSTISAWTLANAYSALSSYDLLGVCHNPQWLLCPDGLRKFAESAHHLSVIVYSHVWHRKLTHCCSIRDSHIQNTGQASDQTGSLYKPAPVSHSHLPAPCLHQCVYVYVCVCMSMSVCVLNVTWLLSKATFINNDDDAGGGSGVRVRTEVNRKVSCPSAAIVLIDSSAGTVTLTLSIWCCERRWRQPLCPHSALCKAKQAKFICIKLSRAWKHAQNSLLIA